MIDLFSSEAFAWYVAILALIHAILWAVLAFLMRRQRDRALALANEAIALLRKGRGGDA